MPCYRATCAPESGSCSWNGYCFLGYTDANMLCKSDEFDPAVYGGEIVTRSTICYVRFVLKLI